jgi:DNA-binding transcriptional ArsR family regulator
MEKKMSTNPNIAEIASLLGEHSRAAIMIRLMDGRFHTASELASLAGIQPQTASFHLAKLVSSKLVVVEKHGRHRYFQLANSDIAQIVESLLTISRPAEIKSLHQSVEMNALSHARTCYDHLAGKLGVLLTKSLFYCGFIAKQKEQLFVTKRGEHFFADLGLDLPTLRKKRRVFCRACLDWSERQHHLAGALGNALCNHFFASKWIVQSPSSRAVKITDKGKIGLKETFHLDDVDTF